MASTSERMLRLLSMLQSHRFWPGTELADRLEVSPRTLRRDIDRLRGLGYLVDATPGVAGGYQLRSGTAMPPLLLDDEEAVAIAVGLCSAATSSLQDVEETSVRALSKVVQVMPPRLRRRVSALQDYIVQPTISEGPTIDAGAISVIAQAARDGERLRFGYRARDGEEQARHVEPHWLVPQGRRWYLVAWDLDRADWRTFRLDRLAEPATTGARFRARELPDDHDPVSFIRRSIAKVLNVELHIEAPPDVVGRVVSNWGQVDPLGRNASRLRMYADEFYWPAVLLASIGAPFTVVRPTELRDYLRHMGRFFADEN